MPMKEYLSTSRSWTSPLDTQKPFVMERLLTQEMNMAIRVQIFFDFFILLPYF